jgi:hypothetical protein
MNKLNLILVGAALTMPVVAKASVIGSFHDFTMGGRMWNTTKGVCSPCHAAHKSDNKEKQLVPLWGHAYSTTKAFTLYSSPTMQAPVGQPTGASLACLSCHDGTVAINQKIDGEMIGTPPEYIDEAAKVGPDLHTTHPISFVYSSYTNNPSLNNPLSYRIGTATALGIAPVPLVWSGTSLMDKTLDEALLDREHKVQCSSCHDVHASIGSSASKGGHLLKIDGTDSSGRGSLLCRNCHLK